MNSFKEWWEDHIAWHYRHKIKYPILRFFKFLAIWFSYFKVCRKVYDFDFSGILEVERHQIERTKRDIIKYQHHLAWERDVRHMDLALKLLSIIMDEDSITERISGSCWTEGPNEQGLYVWKSNTKYKATRYVNTRNAYRFSRIPLENYTKPDFGALLLDDLRVEKAWHLYHKLRKYHMRSWWD